jgi:glycosyltransferase involved in cell wall biosynthesis
MKLLHFVADGRPGGATTHVLQLLAGSQDRDQLGLLTQSKSYLAQQAEKMGVPVFEGNFFRSRLDANAVRQAENAAAGFQPELIHCHGGRAAFFQSWTKNRVPWVYTVHGFHFSHKSFLARKLALLAERRSIKCASGVIFVSEYDRELAIRERLLPSSQTCHVIHNGVPKPTPSHVEPLGEIGWIGRLEYQKHPEMFLDIMEQLPGRRAVLAGGGSLDDIVDREIQRRNLGDRVRRVGSLDHEASINLLAGLDVLVMTSRWEGLPLTPLEAMHLGVPVVSTSVGGLIEIIDHRRTGMLSEHESSQELVDAIRELDGNPELRTSISQCASHMVATDFSEESMLRQTEAAYEHIHCLQRKTELSAVS